MNPNSPVRVDGLHQQGSGWKKFRNTLRFRLALMNALVVVLISLTTLALVRQGVKWALYQELDQLLNEDLQEVTLALRDHDPSEFYLLKDELGRKAQGHRQHGWFVELLDSKGNLIWASEGAPLISQEAQQNPSMGPYTLDQLRIAKAPVPPQAYGITQIVVGARLTIFTREMERFDRLVLFAAFLLIVAAPLCGYWLAGRATRTIGEIIQTASRLRPTHLNERLTIRGVDDELDLLAQTINGLLDRIAAYLLKRREFLANAAHELRTPLAAIRSSIEVALDGREMSPEERTLLEDLIDQANSLEVLVNQLLLITESETGQWAYDPEPVALHEVVTRAVDMFQGVAEFKEITLLLGQCQPAIVSGSRRYLRQVVNNLIDNAVKYTPAGGQIVVSLWIDPAIPVVRLSVADTGVGIAEDDVSRIFERFFRADRSRMRDPKVPGTGLGLSICQAVVLAHEGTIECHSVLKEGTTFLVTLPLLRPGNDAVQAEADAALKPPV